MTVFFRVIKYAFQDMGRNLGLSFMTVFILILMLLSVNALWSVEILMGEAVRIVKEQINVSLYFVPEAKEKDIKEIKNYLLAFPEVTDAQLSTAEDAFKSFQERHKMRDEVMEALTELGENPFGPTLIIKAKEPEDYKKIMEALNVPEYETLIEAKSFEGHEEAVERLQNITSRIEKIGMGLTIMFAIISFLIIFYTVRAAIFTQRIEISIKRLVGASNWFIRGPYLVEAFVFSLCSLIVVIGLIFTALRWIDPYLTVVFSDGFSLTNYYFSHILLLFGSQFAVVLFLTVVSSSIAMRKQLKV
ncbi:MAG: permease-like cell division protein FtsX [Patescibacteria group bacterium]